jgi:Transposase, Mutator family
VSGASGPLEPGLRALPDKRAVAADLKKIYTATDQDAAADELERFAATWDQRYPTISRSWLEHWERIVPFLAFPPDVRRVIYATDESVKGSQGGAGAVSWGPIGPGALSQGRRSAYLALFRGGPPGWGPISGMRRRCRRLRRLGAAVSGR